MNTELRRLLNEIEANFYFFKKSKSEVKFLSFKKKEKKFSQESINVLFDSVARIFNHKYTYQFLSSALALETFLEENGVITICFDEKILGMNFSKLECDEGNYLLIAGITLIEKHNYPFSLFDINSINVGQFAVERAKEEGANLFVSTVINDGLSLEYFHKITGDSCYPFFETKISHKEKKLYLKLAELSFESYVVPNFPDSKFNANDFVVTSDKIKMGFHDSFEKIKHGENLLYSTFIKAWIKYPENEDILFVGKLYQHETLLGSQL